MRLPWSEIRARAHAFVAEHSGDRDERRDTQTFYNDFFRIFGINRRRVAIYEQSVEKIAGNKGFIDLFWPGTLIIEQKSLGKDLFKARTQALDYLHRIKDSEQPRYILVSDFQTFELTDLDGNERWAFTLDDLPKNIERFGFMLGRQIARFKDQDPVNIKAAELVGKLHDLVEASGYTGHRLEVFLTRIVFCLFADDTGIFEPRDILWDWLDNETKHDGSDMAGRLSQLFDILNTPEEQRQTSTPEDLARFPYINGHLFAEPIQPPNFDADMHAALVNACRFDWTPISPAIFGALFQSVMDKAERRKLGAHYTTEKNILKVIGPLFMDDLRAEFDHLKGLKTGRRQRLTAFHDKLAALTFFDPACGCGNFLVIAYRELRLLELDLLKELHGDRQRQLDVDLISKIDVDQFYGIEIEEFPAKIAETALWMMDHLMNTRLSVEFGQVFARIPLKATPTIFHGDALEKDWAELLPPEKCSYVFGNPPFVGAKYQSPEQRAAVRDIAGLGKSGGTLDFVAAWFIKAGQYAQGATRIGFVATNSITQGEQVGQLWPILFDRCKLEIAFAHRTFAWGSDARGKAHVHVVIIGLDRAKNARAERRLFSYADINGDPEETQCGAISPYLFDIGTHLSHVCIAEEGNPINELPKMRTGVQMIDNGILTFTPEEHREFVGYEPGSEKFFRKYIGGDEFINGHFRWILYLRDAPPGELKKLPEVTKRIAAVRKYRSESRRPSTVRMADYPTHVGVDERPQADFLVVPNTSSERREYIPMGWLTTDIVANQKLRILPDPPVPLFGLLTSSMHMAWMRAITGRMKSDYMYSVGVVYNTFPLPPGGVEKLRADDRLADLAQAVLDARAAHPDATLADLYDPDLMPADLRRAHSALDRYVDRLYRRAGFDSDRARVEHLFMLYEKMTAPLVAAPKKRRRKR